METIGLTEWANTPLEYKVGDVRGLTGQARILRRHPETGATELAPVRIVADQELARLRETERLQHLEEETQRYWAKVRVLAEPER
ncbi:MAG: hypothetical protein ACYCS9_04520 [Candidatus Dormibacteria bacterium]